MFTNKTEYHDWQTTQKCK